MFRAKIAELSRCSSVATDGPTIYERKYEKLTFYGVLVICVVSPACCCCIAVFKLLSGLSRARKLFLMLKYRQAL